jgi:DHA2 family multidrug resistance protein-like MFS transporter
VLLAIIFSFFETGEPQGPKLALWLGAGFAALAGVCSALRVKPS